MHDLADAIADRPLPAELGAYAAQVQALLGERVHSIVLFGPALSGERPGRPVDNVLVLGDDDLGTVRRLAAAGPRLREQGVAAPLIMTLAAIDASRDTFPLELLDIQQCHRTLAGPDPFLDLEFEDAHLRLQCERELKTLVIALRQRLLGCAGQEDLLVADDLADAVVRVLRGLLRLRGRSAPAAPLAVLSAAEGLCGPTAATRRAWQGAAGWAAYQAFHDEVRALWRQADAPT